MKPHGRQDECPRVHRAIPGWLLAVAGMALLVPSGVRGAATEDIVAVYASVSPDYKRTPLTGGAFKPETFAFGEGGVQGGTLKDPSIDKLTFLDIAKVIAPSLRARNYVPWPGGSQPADLLIMVYWGTTVGTDDTSSSAQYEIAQSLIPPPEPPPPPPPDGQGGTSMVSDPSTSGRQQAAQIAAALKARNDSSQQQSLDLTGMANQHRDKQNLENASILGYLTDLQRVAGYEGTALAQRRTDVVAEIEESRYFVILLAYDFQYLQQHKQRKLLWEARFSIPQRHNDFSKELAAMALSASRFFGQDSHGLMRKSMHDEHVTLGDLQVIGVEPEKK